MWSYTWVEILEYLSQIPITRIIEIHAKSSSDANTAYLSTICDRDVEATSEESYLAFMKKLEGLDKKE